MAAALDSGAQALMEANVYFGTCFYVACGARATSNFCKDQAVIIKLWQYDLSCYNPILCEMNQPGNLGTVVISHRIILQFIIRTAPCWK